MLFKNLKIVYKMTVLPGLATLGFVVVLVAIWRLGATTESLLTQIERTFSPALALSQDLEGGLSAVQLRLQNSVASSDLHGLTEADSLREAFLERLQQGKAIPMVNGDELSRIEADFQKYYTLARDNAARMVSGDVGSAVTEDLRTMVSLYSGLKELLESNTARDAERMRSAIASTRENQHATRTTVFGIGFACVLLLLALSIWMAWLARQIATPIVVLAEAAEQIASADMAALANEAKLMAGGDLMREIHVSRRQIPVYAGGEVGRLASSFNLMLDKLTEFSEAFNLVSAGLRELVVHVQGAADEVATGSDAVASSTGVAARSNESTVTAVETMTSTLHEMSANVQNVAQSAQSQAASTTETLASIQSLLRSVATVASAGEKLVGIANRAASAVKNGRAAMTAASGGMGEIQKVIGSSARFVEELGAMAKDIGNIVAVIDEIAEQTNLLALNAASEAARAGEHGGGFAVVADEVRKLAERSARSTGEIGDLIRRIQTQVERAVSNMDKSTAIVLEGIKRTDELGASLENIDEAVSEVTRFSHEIGNATAEQSAGTQQIEQATSRLAELTQEITAATEQQSTAAEKVVSTVEEIREMVQNNARSSSELASSSEELSRQAALMRERVSRFQVGGDGHGAVGGARVRDRGLPGGGNGAAFEAGKGRKVSVDTRGALS